MTAPAAGPGSGGGRGDDSPSTGGGDAGGQRPAPAFGRRRLLAAAGAGALAALAAGCGTAGRRPAARGPAPANPAGAADPSPGVARAGGGDTAIRPLYIGTYTTDGGGAGVGLADYDPRTGRLTGAGTIGGVANPSFLALSASGTHLYAVDEQPSGSVTALSVAAGERPRVLGSRSTGGSGPCHLTVHSAGGYLLTANYGSGSVAVHPIGDDGGLLPRTGLVRHSGSGPDPDRQSGPHPHMVLNDPSGAFVLVVDLGTDTVHTYRLDEAAGTLAPVSQAKVRPGSGPRHLAFHPTAGFAYLVNELGDSVVVCRYDRATGALTPGQPQPTVPAGSRPRKRNYPAEVVVSADGAHVYVSNRGDDSVARFVVGGGGSTLRLLDAVPTGGGNPRHIALDPTGALLFAANQDSGTVTVFHVDRATGELSPAAARFASPMPVCVLAGPPRGR